ncbi:MAG: tRNA (guanosine(37)-N1)-methyltransferase TrmD [Patescibacteria group bacterium]
MRFDIITIFPEILDSYLEETILARAKSLGIIEIYTHTPREFATDAHKSIDDKPYGGGAGMVMLFEPIAKTIEKVKDPERKSLTVLLAANGDVFKQEKAREIVAEYEQVIFICGRYEGVDARIEEIVDMKMSVGEYVLAGGELPALVMLEATARLIPGVLGKEESLREESFNEDGYLEYPHYTRPETVSWQGKDYTVPEVLLSGNHAEIVKWRKQNSRHT